MKKNFTNLKNRCRKNISAEISGDFFVFADDNSTAKQQ